MHLRRQRSDVPELSPPPCGLYHVSRKAAHGASTIREIISIWGCANLERRPSAKQPVRAQHWLTTATVGRRARSKSAVIRNEQRDNNENCHGISAVSPDRILVAPTRLRTTLDALHTVTDIEQFSVTHLPFVAGPSFIPALRTAAYSALHLSGPMLAQGICRSCV